MKSRRFSGGFTLAELLIALAILGVIATFTIPKVLQSQQGSEKKSAAKEVAAMLSGAYQAYSQNNTPSASTKVTDLTPFMNYVAVDSVTAIDATPGSGTYGCSASGTNLYCLKLHNGGMLRIANISFNNTASTNALWVEFDPDASYSGVTTGPGKAVGIALFFTGRIASFGTQGVTTCDSSGCWAASTDPSWFDWN